MSGATYTVRGYNRGAKSLADYTSVTWAKSRRGVDVILDRWERSRAAAIDQHVAIRVDGPGGRYWLDWDGSSYARCGVPSFPLTTTARGGDES